MAKPPDPKLAAPLNALAARDPDLAKALADCGLPPRRKSPAGFPGLLRIIVSQQVSTASAAAILTKLKTRMPRATPRAFLKLDEADLVASGFSRAKMRYATALAEDIVARRIDLAALPQMEDEAAIAHLTAAKGIGRWSAEIYLLFSMGRADIMPAGDLALQVAAQRLKGWRERPDDKALRKLAEDWSPHRSAAARFLFHAYRHPGLPEV
ncbi:MAG: DNA-3-methyladenine glycosylase 2 family protein [Kiloniellales bacterium]